MRQNSSKTSQSPQERKWILLTLKDGKSNETKRNVRMKAVQSRRGSNEMEHHTEEESKKKQDMENCMHNTRTIMTLQVGKKR